jgi:hypothetical protein
VKDTLSVGLELAPDGSGGNVPAVGEGGAREEEGEGNGGPEQ